jgi:hypothetical protein
VATQDTVTPLIAAVRRVRREVPAAGEVVAQRCHAHDWDDAGKPRIVWEDKAARDALVSVRGSGPGRQTPPPTERADRQERRRKQERQP